MGGCSSAWLERWPVTPEVAGSNPVSRAISTEMAVTPRLGIKRNLLLRLDSIVAVLSGICGPMGDVREPVRVASHPDPRSKVGTLSLYTDIWGRCADGVLDIIVPIAAVPRTDAGNSLRPCGQKVAIGAPLWSHAHDVRPVSDCHMLHRRNV